MKHLLFGLLFLIATPAFAHDPQKCFKVTYGMGILRTYDYPGYLPSTEYMTKKYGTTGGTTENSSQSATSSVDPGVSTGRFVSTTQFTSSEGGCSYYSYHREMLKEYYVRYRENILDQVAAGHGEHLRSLYYYSSCGDGGLTEFQTRMQQEFDVMNDIQDGDALIGELDRVIHTSPTLAGICQVG